MQTILRLILAAGVTASAFAMAPAAHAACPIWNLGCRVPFPNGPDINGMVKERVQVRSILRNDASPRTERRVPDASSDSSPHVKSILLRDGRELTVR